MINFRQLQALVMEQEVVLAGLLTDGCADAFETWYGSSQHRSRTLSSSQLQRVYGYDSAFPESCHVLHQLEMVDGQLVSWPVYAASEYMHWTSRQVTEV
jgi:hypothetical protein